MVWFRTLCWIRWCMFRAYKGSIRQLVRPKVVPYRTTVVFYSRTLRLLHDSGRVCALVFFQLLLYFPHILLFQLLPGFCKIHPDQLSACTYRQKDSHITALIYPYRPSKSLFLSFAILESSRCKVIISGSNDDLCDFHLEQLSRVQSVNNLVMN